VAFVSRAFQRAIVLSLLGMPVQLLCDDATTLP